ncbi:hypothetical protein AC520_4691 [Enterobacter sp. OLF]|nr:hypothetical protein AC520_4691 [Enterobacter sp. OLF]
MHCFLISKKLAPFLFKKLIPINWLSHLFSIKKFISYFIVMIFTH